MQCNRPRPATCQTLVAPCKQSKLPVYDFDYKIFTIKHWKLRQIDDETDKYFSSCVAECSGHMCARFVWMMVNYLETHCSRIQLAASSLWHIRLETLLGIRGHQEELSKRRALHGWSKVSNFIVFENHFHNFVSVTKAGFLTMLSSVWLPKISSSTRRATSG